MSTNSKKKRTAKRIGIITGIFAGFLLLSILILVLVVVHYYKKVNYVPLKENYTILAETSSFADDVTNPDETTAEDSSDILINEYQSAVEEVLAKRGSENKLPELDEVYNILLVGTDERNPNYGGRSDVMMLVSINKKTKQIVGTSFLRDLYVKIPEKGFDKLNASFAYGGIELLLDTLEYNLSLKVDRYITVNFQSFIDIVDILGGLDICIQEEELYWVNQYIHASNLIVGCDEDSDYLTFANGSPQHLNGRQALAYARVRYVGNGDFTRTERQRTVVTEIFEKFKKTDPNTLIELLDTILPQVTTNIPTDEFLELICLLPELSSYEIVSCAIPNKQVGYGSITIEGISSLAIDMDDYVKYLYDVVYSGKGISEE